ncbi:hypothetical protein OIU77_025705 [Salix suchowensis]|uniref:Uncharacterized protein n=1 Tax=Salix suchowensis TaxID=1278906 RepID=A0ABQ9BX67_9ROSI|nr:hypothetical protein OIU77_025705 [Salix suchowensis]
MVPFCFFSCPCKNIFRVLMIFIKIKFRLNFYVLYHLISVFVPNKYSCFQVEEAAAHLVSCEVSDVQYYFLGIAPVLACHPWDLQPIHSHRVETATRVDCYSTALLGCFVICQDQVAIW